MTQLGSKNIMGLQIHKILNSVKLLAVTTLISIQKISCIFL